MRCSSGRGEPEDRQMAFGRGRGTLYRAGVHACGFWRHPAARQFPYRSLFHGEDHVTLKVRTSALAGEVQKRLEKIAALLSNPTPPDLVLNRHCAECEFQTRCGQKAIEKDDLRLLAGMSEKERKKLHSKGIF